jgi:hypothetical protein
LQEKKIQSLIARTDILEKDRCQARILLLAAKKLLDSSNMVAAGPGTNSWRGWTRSAQRTRAEIKKYLEG